MADVRTRPLPAELGLQRPDAPEGTLQAKRIVFVGPVRQYIADEIRNAGGRADDRRFTCVTNHNELYRTYGFDPRTTVWVYLGGVAGASPGATTSEMGARFGKSIPLDIALGMLDPTEYRPISTPKD